METYTLKNFRVFNQDGGTINVAPLTILTGCNSSGKSSITKSLMLLNPFLSQLAKDIKNGSLGNHKQRGFADYHLDIAKGKHKLGNLDRIVSWNSKDKEFTIEYSVYSMALQETVIVSLTFGSKSIATGNQITSADLIRANISSDEDVFYRYEINSKNEGCAYISTKEIWKDKLINALHFLELGYLTELVNQDCMVINNCLPVPTKFDNATLDSLNEFTNGAQGVYDFYHKLLKCDEEGVKNLCKSFEFKNLIFNSENRGKSIDWDKSSYKYEFPYGNLFPMDELVTELDTISKGEIFSYAEKRFIADVKDAIYNTPKYQQRIKEIFQAYIDSEFCKFSDFYSALENNGVKELSINYGINGRVVRRGIPWYMMCAGTGQSEDEFEYDDGWDACEKVWNEMTDHEKFEITFKCLQGFAEYYISGFYGTTNTIPALDAILKMANIALSEIFCSCEFVTNLDFVELDRSNSQRIYTYAEQGTTFNLFLEQYYNLGTLPAENSNKRSGEKNQYEKGTFAKKWLKRLTSFDDLSIEQAPEGVGFYVFVEKLDENGVAHKMTLADVGYGVSPLLAMLIRIEIFITSYYGSEERMTLCVEEPESNLHPKYQSLLADMFADAITNYPINFILETHSENLIRRLQVLVAEGKVNNDEIALHYLFSPNIEERKDDEKGETQVSFIQISNDGQLTKKLGSGFFDESTINYNCLKNATSTAKN